MKLLQVKDLTSGYEKRPVVNKISFDVKAGTFLGIVGPNGAGKSTLFKIISGALKPWHGTVLYQGIDITSISKREFARHVSAIPQFQPILFPFTVEEFVTMGRYPHRSRIWGMRPEDCRIVNKVIELFDLGTSRTKKITMLSGGEIQRVFLAQGLAQQPELLLLDEPTAHLDISHQLRILNHLRMLQDPQNITVVAILHDLNLASLYCDRIMLMKDGRIYAQGAPEEVLQLKYIQDVYQARVVVRPDPICERPHIFYVPANKKDQGEEQE